MFCARARSENGFSLVEVMVALLVLLVGVLGTVMMIDGANAVTAQTKAREGGTALARTLLEVARGIPYRDLTTERLLTEMASASRPALNDVRPGVAGHQISSRNFTYTVTPVICSMDDPKDDLGAHDDGIVFCADSDVGTDSGSYDRNPDDYRRVAVRLAWAAKPNQVSSVKQTGIVTNPVGGLGPSVIDFDPDGPGTTTITTGTTATYDIKTSTAAEVVTVSANGVPLGEATKSGTSDTNFDFTWNLGDVNAPAYYDCSYVLQAEATDEEDRAGAPMALTVTLNRRAPFALNNFVGGRNLNGEMVDVQWNAGPECDIQGYEVYRGSSPTSIDTPVPACKRAFDEETSCLDQDAPPGPLYYEVVATDKDSNGVIRSGSPATLAISEDNEEAPSTPTGLTAPCTGGNPGCNDINGDPAPVGTAVLSWEPPADTDPDGIAFYRVYRDGSTYGHRLDVLFPVPDKPLVFIDEPNGASHTYRVSAVDSLFGESQLSAQVTWP